MSAHVVETALKNMSSLEPPYVYVIYYLYIYITYILYIGCIT